MLEAAAFFGGNSTNFQVQGPEILMVKRVADVFSLVYGDKNRCCPKSWDLFFLMIFFADCTMVNQPFKHHFRRMNSCSFFQAS